MNLSKEDEKTYWGTISLDSSTPGENDEMKSNPKRKITVNGSVLYGCGLEPQPVGQFIMREKTRPTSISKDSHEFDLGTPEEFQ